VFFSYSPGEYSHTGIIVDVNGNTITTVEGNTSDSVGRRTYETSNRSIAGYGTPNWDVALEIWEKPWVVVVDGKIVNSGDPQADPQKEEEAEQPKEDHSWTPPLLKYDPDNYFEAVKLLQCHLNVRNFNSGKADGYFGAVTQAAVNRAKTYYGLEADGVCDQELWDKLGVT
jgi:hypothetical protein